MVNLMFGANSPKLMRMIAEELQKEEAVREGTQARDGHEITDLVPEEQERLDSIEKFNREQEEIEREMTMKMVHARRVEVAESILEALPLAGIVVVFPQAKDLFRPVLDEVWDSASLKVAATEKALLTEADLEELLHFAECKFSDTCVGLLAKDPCLAHLVKSTDESLTASFDDLLLRTIYGQSRCPPGSAGSPAQKLIVTGYWPKEKNEAEPKSNVEGGGEEDEGEEPKPKEEERVEGVWVPPNAFTRAMALKIFTPAVVNPHVPPEPEPIPPYLAVAYDAFKRNEVQALINEHPKDVMRYGFFTEENADAAELIAKTVAQFEKKAAQTKYGEKMVLQLSRERSGTLLAFADLGPTYISPNTVEGKRECALFFPKGYDEPDVEEGVVEVKKKKRRGKKVAVDAQAVEAGSDGSVAKHSSVAEVGDALEVDAELVEDSAIDGDAGPDEEIEGEEAGDMPEGADKSTSPMAEPSEG